MQCALPTPCFFGVIISDCQLPKFTENTHKIAQNCVQNVQKLSETLRGGGGGKGDVRIGGESAMDVGG